jgi:hypothetical protein
MVAHEQMSTSGEKRRLAYIEEIDEQNKVDVEDAGQRRKTERISAAVLVGIDGMCHRGREHRHAYIEPSDHKKQDVDVIRATVSETKSIRQKNSSYRIRDGITHRAATRDGTSANTAPAPAAKMNNACRMGPTQEVCRGITVLMAADEQHGLSSSSSSSSKIPGI